LKPVLLHKPTSTIWADIKGLLVDMLKLAINDEVSPMMDMKKHPELIGEMMFSTRARGHVARKSRCEPCDGRQCQREAIAKKERFAFDAKTANSSRK
jgi:2-oxoisovalerate dehydrogenase E1 component